MTPQVLFSGKLEPQKGQSALAAPVQRTSFARVGPPQRGQVVGSHASLPIASDARGPEDPVPLVAGVETWGAGSEGCGAPSGMACGARRLPTASTTRLSAISTRIPGHHRPDQASKARPRSQIRAWTVRQGPTRSLSRGGWLILGNLPFCEDGRDGSASLSAGGRSRPPEPAPRLPERRTPPALWREDDSAHRHRAALPPPAAPVSPLAS